MTNSENPKNERDDAVPLRDFVQRKELIQSGATLRNFESYSEHLPDLSEEQLHYGCDPQTSGGLLVAVDAYGIDEFLSCATSFGLKLNSFGEMQAPASQEIEFE